MKVLRGLIAAQWALAAAAFANEFVRFCSGCAEDRSFLVSGAGVLFYGALAVMIWRRKAEAWIAPLLLVGLGAHTMLAAELVGSGKECWMCAAAAVGSALLAGAALTPQPRVAWTLVFFWPVGAAVAAAALPFVSDPEPAERATFKDPLISLSRDSGEIVVFILYGCGACEHFHRERAPELIKRYVEPGTATLRYVPVIQDKQTNEAVRAGYLASYAAELQGKGNEAAEALLMSYKEWSQTGAVAPHLKEILDVERLAADMATPAAAARLAEVSGWAEQVGARRKPALWVHGKDDPSGRLVGGDLSWERLTRAIDLSLSAP